MEIKIQKLTREKDGERLAPMAPGLFMEEMTKKLNMSYSELYRVYFDNEKVNQKYDDPGKKTITYYDQLIALEFYLYKGKSIYQLMYFIDKGTGGIPVAMKWSDETECIVTPIYKKHNMIKKLNEQQINELLDAVTEEQNKNNR
ncbi:MAG: hypothetical protein ACLFUH_01785 [Bacteroidales bacterium]